MADHLYEFIGNKIRELRTRRREGALSQEALAASLKIAANTISRWETGTYKEETNHELARQGKPTPEDLARLARFFKVPISVFFPNLVKLKKDKRHGIHDT